MSQMPAHSPASTACAMAISMDTCVLSRELVTTQAVRLSRVLGWDTLAAHSVFDQRNGLQMIWPDAQRHPAQVIECLGWNGSEHPRPRQHMRTPQFLTDVESAVSIGTQRTDPQPAGWSEDNLLKESHMGRLAGAAPLPTQSDTLLAQDASNDVVADAGGLCQLGDCPTLKVVVDQHGRISELDGPAPSSPTQTPRLKEHRGDPFRGVVPRAGSTAPRFSLYLEGCVI